MSIRKWYLIHKWTSLVSTAFLLMLCITGLPLIFHEEIEHLVGVVEAPPMPKGTPDISLDKVAEAARNQRPQDVIRFMFWEQDEHPNVTLVSMAKTMDAAPDDSNIVLIDTRTAQVLDAPPPERGFMYVMLKLHVDMFAGMPGMLFLGFMGLLFVAAIVSGVVLYHPFMRRLAFGTIRREKQVRLKWLDIHNLLGVATLVWALVVGITGTINTLSQIVIFVWQSDQMAEMIAPYKGLPPPTQLGSLQDSIDAAKKAVPDMHVSFVAFPSSMFSSPHHYTVFLKGNTPLTSRLLRPALIDAQTAKLTDTREMPWYVKTLLLSQPLHFGDYGGLPLKVLWTLLDLVTIVVLVSGLYLWIKRRQHTEQRISELEQKHAQSV